MSENREKMYSLFDKIKTFAERYTLEEMEDGSFSLFYKVDEHCMVARLNVQVSFLQEMLDLGPKGYSTNHRSLRERKITVKIKDCAELQERLGRQSQFYGYMIGECSAGSDSYELWHRVKGYWTIGYWERNVLHDEFECYDSEEGACTALYYLMKRDHYA